MNSRLEVGKFYHMRNGSIAEIIGVSNGSSIIDGERLNFLRGQRQHTTPSGRVLFKFDLWFADGRYSAIGMSDFDIISEAN